jgi:hypothetical protein
MGCQIENSKCTETPAYIKGRQVYKLQLSYSEQQKMGNFWNYLVRTMANTETTLQFNFATEMCP